MAGTILSENIRRLRQSLGLKQDAFADRVDTGQANISKWESGAVVPGTKPLAAMADLANVSPSSFMTTTWSPTSKTADQPVTRTADAGETAEIIRLDLSLPMGAGATVDDYIEEEPLAFDLGYLRSFTRTPPNRLRLARGVGDSMFPTLLSSDLVWIDSTQTVLNQTDRVWAVSINGAAAIKRLRPLKGGRVMVMSDNKAIGDYEVGSDELLIGGRVIRFARDL